MGLNKGQTNNKNGRPVGSKNQTTQQIKELIDNSIDTVELISELQKLIKDKNARTQLEAIKLILAYRYGKPTEYVEVASSEEDKDNVYIIKYIGTDISSVKLVRFEQYLEANSIQDKTYSDWSDNYDNENAKTESS
jgi:hypothetical protein